MGIQRTSVGLDVHARSAVACGLDRETGVLVSARIRLDQINEAMDRLADGQAIRQVILFDEA